MPDHYSKLRSNLLVVEFGQSSKHSFFAGDDLTADGGGSGS
jgi:hypothetical protein